MKELIKLGITEPPADAEQTETLNFVAHNRKMSLFVPNLLVTTQRTLFCPACHMAGSDFQMQSSYKCPECKLHMFVDGNTLYMWKT